MIAASSVETEGNSKPFPQVLPKLSSKYFACVPLSWVQNGKKKTKQNKNERKSVQIHFQVWHHWLKWKEVKSSRCRGLGPNKTSPRKWKMKETWRWGCAAAPEQSLNLFPLCVNTFEETKGKIKPIEKVRLRHHHTAYSMSSLWRSTGTKDWVLEFSD